MTDSELRIFMTQIVARIQTAVDDAEKELKCFMLPRNSEGKFIGALSQFSVQTSESDKDWEMVETTAMALDSLRDLMRDFKNEAGSLIK